MRRKMKRMSAQRKSMRSRVYRVVLCGPDCKGVIKKNKKVSRLSSCV